MVRRDIPLYEEHIYKIKNKYQFILAVAKRARMLVDGAPVAPGIAGVKPTTRALGELLTGKVGFEIAAEEQEEK